MSLSELLTPWYPWCFPYWNEPLFPVNSRKFYDNSVCGSEVTAYFFQRSIQNNVKHVLQASDNASLFSIQQIVPRILK